MITDQGIRRLLSVCMHLKDIAFVKFVLKESLLNLFCVYAQRFPKRVVTLAVDYSLLKTRKDRLEHIKVYDNLRVCYVH